MIITSYAFGYVATSAFGLLLETPEDATYDDINKRLIKTYFFAPSIFSFLRIILLLTFIRFDPPFYYLTISQEDKAREVINKIYKEEY
jgi:short subunit fatty acids transporter